MSTGEFKRKIEDDMVATQARALAATDEDLAKVILETMAEVFDGGERETEVVALMAMAAGDVCHRLDLNLESDEPRERAVAGSVVAQALTRAFVAADATAEFRKRERTMGRAAGGEPPGDAEEKVSAIEFIECDTCRAKPGAPLLCGGCRRNRALVRQLGDALGGAHAILRERWFVVDGDGEEDNDDQVIEWCRGYEALKRGGA